MPKSSANRNSTWDPVLIIAQIISIQTLHYLTLCVIIPPLLAIFARPDALNYEGGAFNVGMVMDWREMAGYPTAPRPHRSSWDGVYSGGRKLNVVNPLGKPHLPLLDMDPMRSWALAFCWVLASCVDIFYLYAIVRRPRFILDFACTLLFNHLVLTSYYAAALPNSLFFWLVMGGSCAFLVIFTEQLCVKREMREGLAVAGVDYSGGDGGVEVPRDPENGGVEGEVEGETLFAVPEDEEEGEAGRRSTSDSRWGVSGGWGWNAERSSRGYRTLSNYASKLNGADPSSPSGPPVPLQFMEHAGRTVNIVT